MKNLKSFKRGDLLEFSNLMKTARFQKSEILIFLKYGNRIYDNSSVMDDKEVYSIRTYNITNHIITITYSDCVQKLNKRLSNETL